MATQIRVQWAANPAADQVLNYELFQSYNGGAYTALGLQGTNLEKVILNPASGTYSFKVKAHNIVGASALSAAGDGPQSVPATPEAPIVTVTVS